MSVVCRSLVMFCWLQVRCLVLVAVDFAYRIDVHSIALERAVIASTFDRCYIRYCVVVVDAD